MTADGYQKVTVFKKQRTPVHTPSLQNGYKRQLPTPLNIIPPFQESYLDAESTPLLRK